MAGRADRQAGQKGLLVGGPASIHTGSGQQVARLIEQGWVQTLFAGNAHAVQDLEQSIYGTSLGVNIKEGRSADHGHEHHLRTINSIRRLGGIQKAIDAGLVKSGIMFAAYRQGIDMVLAGSVRDDGPLPQALTHILDAQRRMHGMDTSIRVPLTDSVISAADLAPPRVPARG